MLRCEDNSLYTGMAKDLDKRMEEHFSMDEKCAKYTKRHVAIKLEVAWESIDRSSASKLEYHIKRLAKVAKESLINEEDKESIIFEEMKLDINNYHRIDNIKIKDINKKVSKILKI